jgi:membrane protease YdiL (CAAX protease family)
MTDGGRRDRAALWLLVGSLAAANVVRSVALPDGAHFAFNVAVGGVALAIGWWASLSRDELGLGAGTWQRGLAYGVVAAAVVLLVLAVASAVPALDGSFDDDRADVSGAELAGRALVVIPLGTVLVEELAFRGVLLALARRVATPAAAAVLTAGLFGLWHVLPAWRADGAGVALGTLVATTVAGFAFGWLRTRSGSLLAPILAHVATNSGALAVAWLVTR